MEKYTNIILGAGVTGLAAGLSSKCPVFEALHHPGGICGSYYMKPLDSNRLTNSPTDGEAYRFEYGGGHWIFGGDPVVLKFMRSLTPFKSYQRSSAVYFPTQELYVPYPIQNHLSYLGKDLAAKVISEITSSAANYPRTLEDWIYQNFGKTLTDLFFAPFHELYTAGLWRAIIPQDAYKSPVNLLTVIQGAFDNTHPVGYNTTYIYPTEGLNTLVQKMSALSDVRYGKKVKYIEPKSKEVWFEDNTVVQYENLISTLPLNKMVEITGMQTEAEPDPYTSVLVLNIGATKGYKCPNEHWLYIPHSKSGFHRVGFYSNVDSSFLPISSREDNNRVSIYVEKAYRDGAKPSEEEIKNYCQEVVEELKAWGFIQEAEVVDPTWVDVAYTWSWSGSQWKQQALQLLEKHDIYQIGRYGRWIFQGIADSIKDGFFVGASFSHR
ncbi:protoporphyrinogen/coproporphyrinogen oxidase [Anabaena azotica]|uniref:FAD-dependent oxidoreductase n=1 Tax=Anabaena azotica FACHB-119 TaxID=947527 RepID=A0ABR8CWW1_9NOST|nr:FAD-dependent oxidoreductase [Anabaena azotica]MBD2499156.1 FAD-dependent oxidoreductase [Anabaena azotica FACHB-119]